MSTNRPLISQSIVRVRREFGAPVTFKDRNVGDSKDAYMECTPYEDPTYDVTKIEQDTGTQVRKYLFYFISIRSQAKGSGRGAMGREGSFKQEVPCSIAGG
mgnify:FL=1